MRKVPFQPPDAKEVARRCQIEKALQKKLKALSFQPKEIMWEGHCLTCRLFRASGEYLGVAYFPIRKLDASFDGALGGMIKKTVSLFEEMRDV